MVIYNGSWERCSPATGPTGLSRRPRERVRGWVILFELLLNHLVAQRAGGILQQTYTHNNTHGVFLFRKGKGVAAGITCP